MGVEIVTWVGAITQASWQLDTVAALGGAEFGPEAYVDLGPRFVATDARSRLFVVNRHSQEVVEYDRNGALIRVVGGEGDGPGELRGVGAVVAGADGVTYVFDFARGGFVQFDQEGNPLALLRWPYSPPPNSQRFAAFSNSGTWSLRVTSGADVNVIQRLEWADASDTVVAAEVAWPPIRMEAYPSCNAGMMMMPPLFIPEGSWDSRGEWTATSVGHGYVVNLFEGHRLMRSVRWQLPERRSTADSAVTEVGRDVRVQFGGSAPCVVSSAEVVRVRGYLSLVPWIGSVTVSPGGEVWIQRRGLGESSGIIDVFDVRGDYRGSLTPDAPFPIAFLDKTRYVALSKDEVGVETLLLVDVRTRESS